jgi:aspartate oxidase
MPRHDERGELAPRDIVARAIDFEMKSTGWTMCWLDATHLGEDFLKSHFPTIHARCLSLGIDIAKQPIPVVPAAHYTCGGVVTDLHGRTDLPGLYAVGETTYTGLHGANRLASNSLLECVVLGRTCAEDILGAPIPESSPKCCRAGTRARWRCRREVVICPQLGRAAPADVELRGHRAHHASAGAGDCTASVCCATRSTTTTRQLPRQP